MSRFARVALVTSMVAMCAAVASGAGAVTFTSADYPIPGSAADSFSGVGVGDLDGRNGPDVVVPQSDAVAQTWVWLNDGTGALGSPTPYPTCSADYGRPALGDFTGDGTGDLLLTCSTDFEIVPGDGHGGFGSPADYTLSPQYYGIVGTLDGRRDVIYPGGFLGVWDICFIALSDLAAMSPPTCGGGTAGMLHSNYIVTNVFAPGANPPYDRDQLIGVADVNDIYVIGYDPQGPGGWSYATRYVGTGPAREVAAGDLNGDGINDVLVANDGSLSVFLAHAGTGGIDVGAQAVPAGGSLEIPYWFQLADVDADGRLDAIVGGTDAQNDAEFAVMLGHGDGTFDAPLRFATGFDPNSTAWWMGVADFNADGKADVVIVNGDERTVRVFLNTTAGAPTTTTTTTTLPRPRCSSIASCLAALQADLPDRAGAANRKARRTATKLQSRFRTLSGVLTRAAGSAGKKRTRLFAKSRADVEALVTAAEKAAGRSTLGVPLAPLEDAAAALRAQIP